MKVKNKKTLVAIIVALLTVIVGTTYALFFSNSSYDNEFSVGNYSFITMETFESPTDWLPGETIDKTIYGMNNGDIPVAFRIKYEERWEDASGNPISNVPQNTVTINFVNQNHWSYNSTDGYYYHKYFIAASDSSCTLISGVTLNEDLMGSASCEMVGDTYTCTSDFDGLAGAKYILTFTKEAVAYNKYQDFWNTDEVITEELPLVQIMNSDRTKDNLQVGDEICINGDTTECFNFIRYDGNNIVMLSKWNLKVGSIYDNSMNKIGEYTNSDVGYGLQSNEARGLMYEHSTFNGILPFSTSNYWYDGSNLKSKYGDSWGSSNIYDIDYSAATGENYSIAYYVEDTLETYGLTVQSARLLTVAEAKDPSIGCSGGGCPIGFLNNTSFWCGSALSYKSVYTFISYGESEEGTIAGQEYTLFYYGVRPVIVISKSDI